MFFCIGCLGIALIFFARDIAYLPHFCMMGPQNIDAEERTLGVESRDEKPGVFHEEHAEHLNKSAHTIAERGYAATDR